MKKIITLIEEKVKSAFNDSGYSSNYGKVSLSDRPDLCDFQCNGALGAAKEYKKSPMIIATDVVSKLTRESSFVVEIANPGFINIKVNQEFLSSYLNDIYNDKNLGCEDLGKGDTIVVDYGGPNVAKPIHIGHLRPAIIGECIKRIKKFCGYKVIGDVHLGDWGLQMGLVMAGLIDAYPELRKYEDDVEFDEEPIFTISDLETIYPASSARSKEDAEFAKRAHDVTVYLQNGHKGYTSLWKKIVSMSVADMKKSYEKLNVEFDLWNGESDAQPYIPAMIEKMKNDGFLYQSQGAWVVDVSKEDDQKEIPPCIIVKSDGASLYTTTDLATLIERDINYSPKEVIYVVDKRQDMHFTQVFRCAKKTGIINPDTKLLFIGFGTMNGNDGKPFKTRSGGTMRLQTLLAEIHDLVSQRLDKSDFNEEEKEKTANAIGLAALKYGDLSNQVFKDYIFDISRFCEFEGNTGPYILYMMVRIKSILKKYFDKETSNDYQFKINGYTSAQEKKLQLELSQFNEVIENACLENAPNRICQYIYSISDKFSSFYNEVNILAQTDKNLQQGYISLITLAYKVLKACIDLLGFDEVEKM